MERGKPRERSHIIRKLAGQIVQMSQNKYASNVIEKCLVYGDDSDKEILIREIIGQSEGNDNLLVFKLVFIVLRTFFFHVIIALHHRS